MSSPAIYRNRASLGHIPVLKGQTRIETPYRLQADANTTALWWFDEGYGSYVSDKKTIYGATIGIGCSWNVLGPWNVGLTFPGSSTGQANVSVASGVNSNFTQEAVCAPAASATIPAEATTGYGGILPMVIGPNSNILGVGFGVYTTGVVVALLKGGFAPSVLCYSTALTTDVFHYFALVVTNNAYELFIDGTSVRTKPSIGQTVYNEILGFGQFFGETQYWTGKIATTRLSSVSRSAAEILTNAKLMGFA